MYSLPTLIFDLAVLALVFWIGGILFQFLGRLIHVFLAIAVVLFVIRLAMTYFHVS